VSPKHQHQRQRLGFGFEFNEPPSFFFLQTSTSASPSSHTTSTSRNLAMLDLRRKIKPFLPGEVRAHPQTRPITRESIQSRSRSHRATTRRVPSDLAHRVVR
jgi:hypothetical protein